MFKNDLLTLLITLSIIILIIYIFKKANKLHNNHEGFIQSVPYVFKQNSEIYDSFYTDVYDDLYKTPIRVEYEYKKIIDMTQPSKKNSVFLDIGSRTGHLVNILTEAGYNSRGIDESRAMIDYSETKFPKITVKKCNMLDSISFDKGIFTHITCMDFVFYHFPDKSLFFKNCYNWLMPNGYLILHLVNKSKFNTIVPAGNPVLLDNPQKYSDKRITDTKINFIDFMYKKSYDFDKDNQVIVKETFTDASTKHVRQNELTLYMENLDDILKIARKHGFIIKGKVNMKNDEHQYIYILERML
jgi:SAM-dependent methyltransferase